MKEYIIKIGDEPDIMGNYGLIEKPKELIRCKDCKFFIGEGHYCKIRGIGRALKPDDFCSDAQR